MAEEEADERPYPLYERVYLVLAASFVVTLVLTNVVGIKLFRSPLDPEFALTTGILTGGAAALLGIFAEQWALPVALLSGALLLAGLWRLNP